MLSYVEVHGEIREHRKTYALARALRLPHYAAVGLLVLLWTWAADNTIDGDLGGYPDGAIARACFWSGSASKLISALKSSGWIDDDGKIHDWRDFGGKLQAKREADRERKRKAPAVKIPQTSTAEFQKSSTETPTEFQRNSNGNPTEPRRNSSDPKEDEEEYKYIKKEARKKKSADASTETEAAAGANDEPLDDEVMKDVYRTYADCRIGTGTSVYERDIVEDFVKEYGPEWTKDAFKIAADNGRRTIAYVRGILQRAKATGSMTLPDRPSTGSRYPEKKLPALEYEQRKDDLTGLYFDFDDEIRKTKTADESVATS